MTWFDSPLADDQLDVIGLVEAIVDKHAGSIDAEENSAAAEVRAALVEAGLWTLGIAEEHGGGGATLLLRLTALCALGRRWAAAAWACAQTHAAVEVLAGGPHEELLKKAHSGAPVAVVVGSGPGIELDASGGRLSGTLWRIDPGGPRAHVLVLADRSTAWLLPPDSVEPLRALRRTGMAGASTACARIDIALDEAVLITGVSTLDVLARLRLSGAAIAAGIALEAAERSGDYARTRIQFGAPLIELPTVRSSLFQQTQLATDALTLALHTEPSPVRAAAVLAGNCERAIDTATAAVQSHGGYGYLAEYDVERLLRDAVSLRAASGAAHGASIAAALLAGCSEDQIAVG